MRKSMKLVAVAAAATVMTYAVTASITAQAGQEPYVAYVDNDSDILQYYISPKLKFFTHDNTDWLVEGFDSSRSTTPRFEQCRTQETNFSTNENWRLSANDEGEYHWNIVLPKKPVGNLNITIQCGILKPNAEAFEDFPVNTCAGETGERIDPICDRRLDRPNRSNIKISGLPRLKVVASVPGLPSFVPFQLTAYRNPGSYVFTEDAAGLLRNTRSMQILNGGPQTRFALKACMTKSIYIKKPVTGQRNWADEEEFDLEAGDLISVWVRFPRGHTMDVYCHAQSVSVQGIGDPLSLVEGDDLPIIEGDD